MKIMIVDDSIVMHDVIRDHFRETNTTFIDCSDGTEAIAAYEKNHPDWVLMDIMMKEMDGFRATEAILARDPKARIIIITQHNESSLIERSRQVGARGFVLKENLFDIERIMEAGKN